MIPKDYPALPEIWETTKGLALKALPILVDVNPIISKILLYDLRRVIA